MKISELEYVIESNQCEGKPTVFKARIQEPNDPEFYYRKTVDGFRYGSIGIYEDNGLWYVIHARSGRSCGVPFSSREQARRLAFLLRNITKWSKVDWKDDRTYEADELFWTCFNASEYCSDIEGDYDSLVAAVAHLLPGTPVGNSGISEEIYPEIQVVEFGCTITN